MNKFINIIQIINNYLRFPCLKIPQMNILKKVISIQISCFNLFQKMYLIKFKKIIKKHNFT